MSTATDILGKIGEKVGLEIKDIKDNFATKVSLGNVSGSIDFSPYATVVSLGSVKSELKASLASYTSGNSVFTNLKAQRAEVDELVVKGDTTIVNTQTVEVSDNVIEVNLAADDDITADTGGLAVNRGLRVAGTSVNSAELESFTEGSVVDVDGDSVINSLNIRLNKSGAAAAPLSKLIRSSSTYIDIELIKPENATDSDVAFGDKFLWRTDGINTYNGVYDLGFNVVKTPDGDYVPEYITVDSDEGYKNIVWKHGREDLGNGEQDVYRRLDTMPNSSDDKIFEELSYPSMNPWTMNLTYPDGTTKTVGALAFNNHPYNPGFNGALVDYISLFSNDNFIPFSEAEAKAAGAELGPDLVKYILRDENPNAAHGGNTLGSAGVALNGPATKVNGEETNLPEYLQYGNTGQDLYLDQIENTYSVRAYFTEDNKVMAKAIEFDSDDNITVLDSTETQIGTWSNDGTNTTIAASSDYTIVLQQWLSSTPGSVTLRINYTPGISTLVGATYSAPPVSFTDEPFELGNGDWYNFVHSSGDKYYWRSSFTNSTYDITIDILQSTTDGTGDVRFRVNGSNVASCNYKGENYQELNNSGYSNISVTWKSMGTHTEIESVTVTYTQPGDGLTFVPDIVTRDTTSIQAGNVRFTGIKYELVKPGNEGSLTLKCRGFGPVAYRDRSDGIYNFKDITAGNGTPYIEITDAVTWTQAGVNGDAELLWDEPKGAWTLNKDGGAAKLYYGNIFPTASDLPSASTYHGMFAHVHDTGRGYFAHNGAWQELLDLAANQTVNGNLEFSAGNALKVADSSGIVINNVSLGNYASFENALTTAKS